MPQLLKPAVTTALIELLAPIREEFLNSKEWQEIEKQAYPPPEVKKKVKKEKNLGSRNPRAGQEPQGVEAKPDGHIEGKTAPEVNLAKGAQEAMANIDLKPNEPS